MKIRTKLLLGYLCFCVPVALAAWAGYRATTQVGQEFDGAINRTQPVLLVLQNIRHEALRLSSNALHLSGLAQGSPVEAAAEPASDKDGHDGKEGNEGGKDVVDNDRLRREMAHYRTLVVRYFPAELDTVDAVDQQVEALYKVLQGSAADRAAQAYAVSQRIEALTREAEEDELRELTAHQAGIEGETARHQQTIAWTAGGTFAAALFIALLFAHRLSRPIVTLHRALARVAQGHLGARVPETGSDEVGDLARAFNAMADSLGRSLVSREYVENIVDSMAEAMIVVDADGRIERTNRAVLDLLGLPHESLAGRQLESILPQAHRIIEATMRSERLTWMEVELHGAEGRTLTAAVSAACLHEQGRHAGMVLLAQDITDRKRAEERLAFLATYDPITNLPNRNLLLDHLRLALSRLAFNGRLTAVLFCDLDGFKFVNDTLGHETGDHLLQQVGQRLIECVRPGDTVARLAGDELVVLLADVAERADIDTVAQRIVDAIAVPIQVDGHQLYITVSVGIAISDGSHAIEPTELISQADVAMYAAKANGRNGWRHFSVSMRERSAQRIELETALRLALAEGDQLRVHYQPLTDIEGGLIGYEALVRWQHPQLGLIEPGRFLPVADAGGLMSRIDAWVMETACRDAAQWPQQGLADVRVAVNVSDQLFRHGKLPQLVQRVLDETGLPARRLEIELTEAIVMSDVDQAIGTMQALRDMGVGLAVDDFGTGYSSLAHLKRCPVDILKIDRSFVRQLCEDRSDAAIVEAIVVLAHKLGIQVLAEGVETVQQRQALRALGCDALQGYLLGRPMPLAALPDSQKQAHQARA